MKLEKMLVIVAILLAAASLSIRFSPSLFVNQHFLVNISGNGNDINCTSCHPQVADELAKSQIHRNFPCEECHRIKRTAYGVNITYAEQNAGPRTIGEEAHAVYVPRCLDCHGNNGVYVDYLGQTKTAPVAKGFNVNPIPDYVAHKNFVEWANKSNICVGENEACLSCHTNFSVKIIFRYFYNISFTKTADWNIANFNVNGTRTYTVLLDKTSNQGKHEWIAVNLSSQDSYNQTFCIRCHKNIYDALVNGTLGTDGRSNLIHAPIEIDTTGHRGGWNFTNNWGHVRYHYILPSYRGSWVNTTYCLECHNVKLYSLINPNDSSYYGLSNVITDTNSTNVNIAEKLTCVTCHGFGKIKEAVIDYPSSDMNIFVDHLNLINQTDAYASIFSGKICMACHTAGNHVSDAGGMCRMCHGSGGSLLGCDRCHGRTGYSASITFNVESEPTGNVTWS